MNRRRPNRIENSIRFGASLPKFSDGSAAIFDSIFDLEPGHRPKPSNRTEIRFAKPLNWLRISLRRLCTTQLRIATASHLLVGLAFSGCPFT